MVISCFYLLMLGNVVTSCCSIKMKYYCYHGMYFKEYTVAKEAKV